jgi:hypothetical protein
VPDIRTIDETLVTLIGVEDEASVFDAIGRAVRRLPPGAFVVISALSADGTSMRITAAFGFEKVLERGRRLLGVDPFSTSFTLDQIAADELARYRSGRLNRVEGGLYTVALGALPRPACAAVERLLRIGATYAIGLAWSGMHYGGVIVFLQRGQELEHAPAIEALVH